MKKSQLIFTDIEELWAKQDAIKKEIELCDDIVVYVGLLVMLSESIKKSDELFEYWSKVAREEQTQKMHDEYYEKYMLDYLYN